MYDTSPIVKCADALLHLRHRQADLARARSSNCSYRSTERLFETAVGIALDDYWDATKALKEWAYREFICDLAQNLVVIQAED